MFFELVSISFAIVLVYGNEYMTKEDKNLTSFNNFCTKTKFKPQHSHIKSNLSFSVTGTLTAKSMINFLLAVLMEPSFTFHLLSGLLV